MGMLALALVRSTAFLPTLSFATEPDVDSPASPRQLAMSPSGKPGARKMARSRPCTPRKIISGKTRSKLWRSLLGSASSMVCSLADREIFATGNEFRPPEASQEFVCFGSKADLRLPNRHVR
jgi:hypothetical protein